MKDCISLFLSFSLSLSPSLLHFSLSLFLDGGGGCFPPLYLKHILVWWFQWRKLKKNSLPLDFQHTVYFSFLFFFLMKNSSPSLHFRELISNDDWFRDSLSLSGGGRRLLPPSIFETYPCLIISLEKTEKKCPLPRFSTYRLLYFFFYEKLLFLPTFSWTDTPVEIVCFYATLLLGWLLIKLGGHFLHAFD